MDFIFVDDDSANISKFVCTHFIDYNVNIKLASGDLKKLYHLIKPRENTVVFLDIMLGRPKNGIMIAKDLLRKYNKVKIVFISGYVYEFRDEITALENTYHRIYGSLDKPVDKRELKDIICTIFEDVKYDNEAKNQEIPKEGIVFVDTPYFDMIVDNKYVKFKTERSKSFLQQIVYEKGGIISDYTIMNEVFFDINDEKKNGYKRQTLCLLKKTLREYDCEDIIVEVKKDLLKNNHNKSYRLDYPRDKSKKQIIIQIKNL